MIGSSVNLRKIYTGSSWVSVQRKTEVNQGKYRN